MKNFGGLIYAGMFFVLAHVPLMAANVEGNAVQNAECPQRVSVVPDSFVGSWDYTVSDVPYEYRTGVLLIGKENNEYTVQVKLQYSTEQATEVSVDKNKLNFSIFVEGEKVAVSLELKDNTISGKANSSLGQMSLVGKRSEKS